MRFLTMLFLLGSLSAAQVYHISMTRPSDALPVLNGKKTGSGELLGEAEFGGRRVKALFHRVRGGRVLAIQTGARRLCR